MHGERGVYTNPLEPLQIRPAPPPPPPPPGVQAVHYFCPSFYRILSKRPSMSTPSVEDIPQDVIETSSYKNGIV